MTDYVRKRYSLWMDSPYVDEETKTALAALREDEKALEDSFYQSLTFGTAGLRGILGPGDNRMNLYTVRRATFGLAAYLSSLSAESSVAIAYDSRNCSALFARETARVLAAAGIQIYLYSTLRSVPQLSFAVLEKKCTAGVVITASHNPPEYNGYKVYWSHGGQVGPEQADAIFACIQAQPDFADVSLSYQQAVADGKIRLLGEETDELYYQKVETLVSDPEKLKAHGGEVSIVYTPLHGTGYVPVTSILKRIGITNCYTVPEQSLPDGDFPTVAAPNPEFKEAFTLGIALAEKKQADLVLATDPDADRLGVAVKTDAGDWNVLTGNQIGALLLHSVLTNRRAAGKLSKNGLMVRSMVSTHLADVIARDFGLEVKEVLTGFRFISEQIDLCEKTGKHTFEFGFEESNGYLAGTFCRDKDSISAAVLLAETAVYAHLEGKTLYDRLTEIYNTYGWFGEVGFSFTLAGKEGIEKIGRVMENLRCNPPACVGADAVTAVLDYRDTEKTGLPKSNVLAYTLSSGSTLIVRPSGTEPKLKLYMLCRADSREALEQSKQTLTEDAKALLNTRFDA